MHEGRDCPAQMNESLKQALDHPSVATFGYLRDPIPMKQSHDPPRSTHPSHKVLFVHTFLHKLIMRRRPSRPAVRVEIYDRDLSCGISRYEGSRHGGALFQRWSAGAYFARNKTRQASRSITLTSSVHSANGGWHLSNPFRAPSTISAFVTWGADRDDIFADHSTLQAGVCGVSRRGNRQRWEQEKIWQGHRTLQQPKQ